MLMARYGQYAVDVYSKIRKKVNAIRLVHFCGSGPGQNHFIQPGNLLRQVSSPHARMRVMSATNAKYTVRIQEGVKIACVPGALPSDTPLSRVDTEEAKM